MYSLDLTPDEPSAHASAVPRANDVRAVVAPGDNSSPDACEREKEELDRLRANPVRDEAERFARAMTCAALKPQAARLLESLTD
jgi:hypothetical protein